MNYGVITDSGRYDCIQIAGIVGGCGATEQNSAYVQNCVNYGTISINGISSFEGDYMRTGGVVGVSFKLKIENCLSAGEIKPCNASIGFVGAVVGYANTNTNISHCYWTSDTGYDRGYEHNESGFSITDSNVVELNATTLDALRGYAGSNGWNKWAMLHLNGGRIGNASKGTIITPQKHIPDLEREEASFAGWCKDSELTEEFDPETDGISTVTDLYAKWSIISITSPDDFISLSKNVSKGMSYEGVTVVLGDNIDFTGKTFEPIGNMTHYFLGTFDGQGHAISNLKMNSASRYTGLFGYSKGLAIKNLVMDESCSFVSSYTSPDRITAYVGGITGWCNAAESNCVIENIVNMGSVAFTGSIGYDLYLGGIAGNIDATSSHDALIRNCVNYGSVIDTGSYLYNHIGGVAGSSWIEYEFVCIQNCANYGTITVNGKTSLDESNKEYLQYMRTGGIIGGATRVKVENCLSVGKIKLYNTTIDYVGAVVGYANTNTSITHCYWTSDTGYSDAYGISQTGFSFTDSSIVELDTTTLDTLGSYAGSKDWSKWVMLHLNGGRIGNASQGTIITPQKYIPDPVIDGNTFLFWC